MSLQSLQRRIAAISASLEAMRPAAAEPQDDPFCMELLTTQEQDTLIEFLESIKDKTSGNNGLSRLNEIELDTLSIWLELGQSLEQRDSNAAAKYRRWLATPLEQVVQAFLGLDLSFLPEDRNVGIPLQEDGCTYHLSRSWYRYITMEIDRKGPGSRLEDMRRWLSYVNKDLQA